MKQRQYLYVKVNLIPPIRDYELGLCVLFARSGGGGWRQCK
jgi:hypothetical protein